MTLEERIAKLKSDYLAKRLSILETYCWPSDESLIEMLRAVQREAREEMRERALTKAASAAVAETGSIRTAMLAHQTSIVMLLGALPID